VSTPEPAATPKPAWLRLLPLAVLAAGVAAAFALGWTDYLRLDALRDGREQLLAYVEANPVLSVALYAGLYAVVTALSLPGASVLTLAGGFLFGALIGGPAAVVGATVGGTVVFAAMRTAVGDLMQRRFGPRTARITEGLRDNAFSYLLTLRLLPIAPFWLVNLAAGLVNMPLRTFVAATFLGIIPGTLIYSWLGQGLGAVFANGGEPDLFQPQFLLPLIALGLLSLAPAVVRRLRRKPA
jgi:uncharacterized membrane protein YdjX (TVP38/TMEM64 family)